jgi:hypothetical protein
VNSKGPRVGARMTTRNRLPELSSLVYLPRSQVDLDNVIKQLTAQVQVNDAGESDDGEDGEQVYTKDIELYDISRKGLIGVPRAFFREKIGGPFLDRTVRPKYDPAAFPNNMAPRNPEQAAFVAEVTKYMLSPVPLEAQVIAHTGAGKTFSAIKGIADSGIYPVVIGVHRNTLKNQWLGSVDRREGFRYFMGEEWTARNVGVVQQDRCDFKNKKVIIAMMPSVVVRSYPHEFYDSVAAVVIDEVHKCATPTLAQFLLCFRPRILIGMTATEREGSGRKVIRSHIGKPKARSQQEGRKPKVYRITIEREVSLYGNSKEALISSLAKQGWRNDLIARLVYERGISRSRNVLMLSDRVHQLQDIRDRLIEMGMDPETFGLYVGEYETGLFRVTCKIGGRVRRIPERFRSADSARRFAVKLAISEGHSGPTELRVRRESIKPKDEYYEEIKSNHKYSVIGATYGIFDTGTNIQRLDLGVECTPRGNVKQAIGRLRAEDRPQPEWYSLWDKLYYITSVGFGKNSKNEKTFYQDFLKLEKARRKSYAYHKAKLIGIGNDQILYH